jgi:TonB family protein
MGSLFLANLLAWALQVAVLVISAAVVARLVPVDSAAVRHAWWRAVLLVCLALPLIQPWTDASLPPAASVAPTLDSTVLAITADTIRPSAGPALAGVRSVLPSWSVAIAIVLACGAALRLAWLAAGLLHLRRLRRAGAIAEGSEPETELQALVQAGAEIRYVPVIGQPVTFGVRRPVVLLPTTLRGQPAPVQRAVLAHELWHVRRRDWIWVVVEETIRGLLWFHPAIWWLVSRVQSSREEVVDELTVLLTNSRRSYLEALLAFADEPPLFPAAPFAVRRRLFDRMLLISKEAVMSSRRIVASCAAMVAVLATAGWYGADAFPLTAAAAPETVLNGGAQQPPRDPRPGEARPASSKEIELQKALVSTGGSVQVFLELAKLQEQRGAMAEAESTLLALKQAHADKVESYQALAGFYTRTNRTDRAIAIMEEAAALDSSNPRGHQIVATYYEELVRKHAPNPVDRATYISQGIAATDRALAADPDFVDALVYKNILLRHQAATETDRARQQALLAEADSLRNRAMELRKANPQTTFAPAGGRGMPPPPPPPPPPGGKAPVRVGGNIKPPTKTRDVRPVYPDEARSAGVQGVVILEALIDESGQVIWTQVLRSIPMLDQAAREAVQQWQFTPTLLNGEPVPVIMTVTVNFTLQ